MKNPCGAQSPEIARVDFGKAAIATTGIVAVIGDPVRGGWLNQQGPRNDID